MGARRAVVTTENKHKMDTSNFSSDTPEKPGDDSSFSAPEKPAPPSSPEAGHPEAGPATNSGARNGGRNFRNRRFRGRKQNRHGGQGRPNGNANGNRGVFTGPMDHSYRQQNGDNNAHQGGGFSNQRGGFGRRNRFRQQYRNRKGVNQGPDFGSANEIRPLDPSAMDEDAATRIFAFVEDLFFMTKIMDTAKKLNVKVEFVKTLDDLMQKIDSNGEEKPSLVIFDLNNANAKPLTTIPKVRSKLKKGTSILGFVSHVQGDLKMKAQEAGCDSVMPRSAFSQNLPSLLRRHGTPEESESRE